MCPPRYGFVPPTKHISLMGVSAHPFYNGGKVLPDFINLPERGLPQGDPDRVYARLMPGEVVIPVQHVPLIKRFLDEKGIKLPNM